MSDQDDVLTLRDKFAIDILQALLLTDDASTKINYQFIRDFVNFYNSTSKDQDHLKNIAINAMERKIRAAYKMADMMRKIRLTTFE